MKHVRAVMYAIVERLVTSFTCIAFVGKHMNRQREHLIGTDFHCQMKTSESFETLVNPFSNWRILAENIQNYCEIIIYRPL